MMSHIDLSKLLNDRNTPIWETVNKHFEVEVVENSIDEYSAYSLNDKITFSVPLNDLCADSFTHELLHAEIKVRGVYVGSHLVLTLGASRRLQPVLDFRNDPLSTLYDHMGNCLEHMVMYPRYIKLGCAPDRFTKDHHEFKLAPSDLSFLKQNYWRKKSISASTANYFIGKYFAAVGDHNETFDYSLQLATLKKIDPQLYSALEGFIGRWRTLDLDSEFPADQSRAAVDHLYSGLKVWMTNKTFI